MRTALGWAALVAALVGTASAEYSLALACGFHPGLAVCVPAALDIYALAAFRAHRDVAAVVIALICVNSLAHLVSGGQLPVSVPLVVTVSAIAPLVLWRVHALQASAVPDAPECTPDAVPSAPDAEPSVMHPREMQMRVHAALPEMQPDAPQPDATGPQPDEMQDAVPPPADELLPSARDLDAAHREEFGRPVPLRRLQAELHIGQRRAMDLKAAMAPAG